MSEQKTPETLWPMIRQYRHNTDNSPDYFHPKDGFVCAFAYDETVQLVLAMQERIAELKSKLGALVNAVNALPVQECIGTHNGEPYLIGYGMQAQGEWHDVLSAIDEAMKDE